MTAISPASAGFFDGNKLHTDCRSSRLFVLGFVAGVYDENETGQGALFSLWLQSAADSKEMKSSDKFEKAYTDNAALVGNYCAPKGIILDQVTDIFCQYLTANPAERHKSASFLLTQALNQAWPCK